MSTSERFLNEEEVLILTRDIPSNTSISYGYEGEEFAVCPYVNFYIFHPDDQRVEDIAKKIIDVYEEFEIDIIDKPFKLRYRDDTEAWKNATKWQPSRQQLIDEMHQSYKKYFIYYISATTSNSEMQSARWAFSARISDSNVHKYTTVKMNFGDKWYREHKEHWHHFVQKCLLKFKPIQAYSGYEIGNCTDFNVVSPDFETVERIFSDYFYGLDIDHPNMGLSHNDPDGFIYLPSLAAGIRTPTWCFLLSAYWMDKLGLTEQEIRTKLNDTRINISQIPSADEGTQASLWIQLGELSLYPVEEGVPELLMMANELIKPIRCDHLKLTTTDAWDDDPNPRFNIENSPQWLARFDSDSTWPEGKRVTLAEKSTPQVRLTLKAGEKCPQSGYWISVSKENSRRYFNQGELFPRLVPDGDEVSWRYDDKYN